jgi:hypothetical protein
MKQLPAQIKNLHCFRPVSTLTFTVTVVLALGPQHLFVSIIALLQIYCLLLSTQSTTPDPTRNS